MRPLLVALALGGCGRYSFDALPVDALSVDAASPWSLRQTRSTQSATTPMMPTGAGNLLVVAIETAAVGPVTSVTDDVGNIYVPAAGSRGADNPRDLGIEIWYASRSIAGATRVTTSAATVWATAIWEVEGSAATDPLEVTSALDDQPATNSPVGAPITTTTDGNFVVTVAIVSNVVDGLSPDSAFTNDHTSYGNGWAHLTSATAPAGTYQAQWVQPNSGSFCATSAAFRTTP